MWRRNDRINERDVPESQHTIFMRGFPGEMGTDQIRDFLEKEDFGTCSFDFVKVNPDRTKLYVAVRFESKSSAREAMERFGPEGEMLGYKVELSWFRDIRRYLAHCVKQGVRPSRFRGGGGGGGGGGMGQHRQVYHNQRGGGFIGRGGQHRGKRHTAGGEMHEGQRSRSASRSRSADTNSRTGSPASPRRARSGSANSRRSSSAGRSRSAESRRRSRSSSSQSVATNSSLGGGAGAGDNRSSLEREKSLDYSDIVTTRKEQKQRELSHSPTPPPLKKSKKAVLKRLKKGKKDKEKHRDQHEHRCLSKKKVKQYGKQQQQLKPKQHQSQQQQNMTPPHSSSVSSPEARHRHRTEESDVEMASDEEEQQQQTEHEQQQEMNTKSSSKTKQKQQFAVGVKKSSFVNHFLPAGAGAGTVTGGAPSMDGSSVKTTATSAELRSHTIVLDLSDPKTNAMPLNFKPFDDASSVDCMLNDSLNASSNNGGTITTTVAAASATPPNLPQFRNGPTENNAMGKMPQQNGSGGGGGCGGGGAGLALNSFKDIQRAVLADVHYKVPHEVGGTAGGTSDEDAAPMGQLRLSALSRKGTAEEKREEKVAKLSPELRERVNKKKRQLELSYRSDCETYGLVANKLIANDRLLEDRLKLALLETMKELEVETMKQLDDFLDQITFMHVLRISLAHRGDVPKSDCAARAFSSIFRANASTLGRTLIDVCVVQFLPQLEPLIPTAYIVADKVFRTLFHYKRRFIGKAVQLLF
ncbi:hypothetical protein niasHT_027923 [Heterodera trifolii]|uniref:RRM domain-containing protein n=1 Tax=Heterodera trifolii TaxID=157864 RepID=A0ABD2JX15_9BILA